MLTEFLGREEAADLATEQPWLPVGRAVLHP
jgi:hypothetical protein